MPTTTDQQISIPQGTDLANVVATLINTVADLERRLNLAYANTADRTARHPVGIEGECSDLAAESWADSFDGANWISRTARGYRAMRYRTTDAAAINNSVALVNDAVLVAPIEAAGVFVFGGQIFYDASTIADLKLAFTWPGVGTTRWGGMGRASGTNTNIDAPCVIASGGTLAFGALGAGAGSTTFVQFSGILANTGVAGNLQTQYAQNTLDPSNLVVRAGSNLWVMRIA